MLFGFWFLLSGKKSPFYLIVGLLCALGVAILSHYPRLGASEVRSRLKTIVSLPLYVLWLLSRIFLAAFHVSKVVLSPKMKIAPQFIEHRTSLKTEREKVLFANSITLTPGTITAEIDGETFYVHQLDEASAGDIKSGAMENKIAKVF